MKSVQESSVVRLCSRLVPCGLLLAGFSVACSSAGGFDAATAEQIEALTTTVSFQDGQLPTTSYSGTADTMLDGTTPNTANGADTSISVDGDGQQEVLISWDVSGSIPPFSVLSAAAIDVRVSDKSSDTFTLYEAKPAWNEAQATWNASASGVNWQTPGGSGSSDRGTVALGTFSAPSTGSVTVALNAAGVAVVQNWVNNPSSNHGLFVVGPTSTNRLEIRASEYSTKSQRPKLSVTWSDGSGGTGGTGSGGAGSSGASAGSGSGGVLNTAWPGQNAVVTVDGSNVFGSNLSGLFYEPGATPVLWAVRNGPETLHRLLWNGSTWANDTASGWGSGKTLHYPGGSGAPDSEDVTKAEYSSSFAYVATERDNNLGTSRLSVLMVDTSISGSTLTATREWNMTSDLPSVAANSGLEAITWVPDTHLVAKGFFDERLNKTYAPADYPDHGTGLFIVGLEQNGMLYTYALNQLSNAFQRVSTIASGHSAVMGISFDREIGYLWAHCDNGCNNQDNVLEIDTAVGSPTLGKFKLRAKFARPTTMSNINNEGITFAPESSCVAGYKPFFWTDDDATNGHSIRRDSIPCGHFF